MSFIIALLFFFSEAAYAEEIYKSKTKDGRVVYSSKPKSEAAKPINLPNITKEKANARLKQIEARAPGTCAGHGGIDCSKGEDSDGSVICKDAFRDAELPYRFECLTASLESDILVKLYRDKEVYRLASLKRDQKKLRSLLSERVEKITISVRNTSEIDASEIAVTVVFDENKIEAIEGPELIKAYGLADFTIKPNLVRLRQIKGMRADIACANCRTIKRLR